MDDLYLLLGGGKDSYIQQTLAMKADEDWIGVDAGALYLVQAGIRPLLAIGDFDSVDSNNKNIIKGEALDWVELDKEKDLTDSEYAVAYALEHFPDRPLKIYLPSKGRLDHLLANLFMPSQDPYYSQADRLEVYDANNVVSYYLPGHHLIKKRDQMTYLGIVAIHEVKGLTLEGLKYPLQHAQLPAGKVYTSNEFLEEEARVSFDQGLIMLIQSKD